jgi:hypothetical protein
MNTCACTLPHHSCSVFTVKLPAKTQIKFLLNETALQQASVLSPWASANLQPPPEM